MPGSVVMVVVESFFVGKKNEIVSELQINP